MHRSQIDQTIHTAVKYGPWPNISPAVPSRQSTASQGIRADVVK